jgi:hypothetical protein
LIPAVSAASHNVRGFSAYGRDFARKLTKQEGAKALFIKHHLTFFQETNLLDREDRFFKSFLLPDFTVRYSSLSKTTAGVAIVISPHINSLYTYIRIPLPKSLDGYALALLFTAKDGSHSFTALNLYLDSSGSPARRVQLKALKKAIPPSPYLMVGGTSILSKTNTKTPLPTLPTTTAREPSLAAGQSSKTIFLSKRSLSTHILTSLTLATLTLQSPHDWTDFICPTVRWIGRWSSPMPISPPYLILSFTLYLPKLALIQIMISAAHLPLRLTPSPP